MSNAPFLSLPPDAARSVAVLPGGPFQASVIRKVRDRGYQVVCADRFPHCPGSKVADHFLPVGLHERERLLAGLQPWRPAGIITDQSDSGVRTVAWLCERLDLPGIGLDCAELFTNKRRMRDFCRVHRFSSPDYRFCQDLFAARRAAEELGYPVVIKPPACQSSQGVHRADSAEELGRRFPDTARLSPDGCCLVEQFLAGTEFTVEGFQTAWGHRTLAISEKQHYSQAPMVARSLLYTPTNPRFDYAQLRGINDALVNATQLPFGITHAEYIYANGSFQLVEIAARGGGTHIASDIVPWVSGVDPQLLLLEAAVGGAPQITRSESAGRCALLEFFDFPAGRVYTVAGLDEARCFPGVLTIQLAATVRTAVPPVMDDTSRPGYFILTTETPTELLELRERVLGTIRVECE